MIYELGNYKFEVLEIDGISQPTDYDIEHIKYFLSENPERNKIMIDIGAYLGLFSIIYSQFFETVYAIEPNKESFEYLENNIKLNSCNNVIPMNIGISNSGPWRLVSVVKIDDLFKTADFIKTNTGNDIDVLRSGSLLLKNSSPFIQADVSILDGFELGYDCISDPYGKDCYFRRCNL